MKVKIGDKIYDAKIEPIMIIVNKGEREQIYNMNEDCTKYCQAPKSMSSEEMHKFMETK